MTMATRWYRRELQVRDGFLLVVLVWSVLPIFATLPFMFFMPQLSFADAYFEAASGITTTGATILSSLDSLPPSINLWRCELQWLGGMGLIVLAVAILPLLGVGGRQMFIIAYRLAGMDWIDAVMHAFTTLSLGGVSSHDASFGYWDSALIECVAIFFMLVAGLNFASHFLVWRAKSFLPYRNDPEAGMFIMITAASCIGLTFYLWLMEVYPDPLTALRFASFNTVSIATSTGYSSTDYYLWPIFAPLWMLFLSSFCSSSGSTGGGIKMIRAQILFKQVFREMILIMHPQAISPVKVGGSVVPNRIVFAVLAFLSIYIASIASMTLILTLSGLDLVTALSAIVACINNLGPGFSQVGPATTFSVLTDFQIWVCSFAMLLGRLELFTLLIVFTPAFWRK